jgi:hypothetical protein
MTNFLIIGAIVAAIYIFIFAAIAYYYGFKEWYPLFAVARGRNAVPRSHRRLET